MSIVSSELISDRDTDVARHASSETEVAEVAVPRRRNRNKSRRYKALERKFGVVKILFWSFVLLVVAAGFFTYGIVTSLRDQNLRLVKQKQQQDQMMLQLRQETDRIRSENRQLVMGRIPGLRRMAFGQVLSGEAESVKSILFTITGTSGKKHYQYMAVVHNEVDYPVEPKVELFVFNSRGVQVGKALVTTSGSTEGKKQKALNPGESRTYSAQLLLSWKSIPEYFLIKSRSHSLSSGQ